MKNIFFGLLSFLFISNASAEEIVKQFDKTANLLKLSHYSSDYNGILERSYLAQGVDRDNGTQCTLQVHSKIVGKNHPENYAVFTLRDTDASLREAMSSPSVTSQSYIQDRKTLDYKRTVKTSHVENEKGIVIERSVRFTDYSSDFLIRIPIKTTTSRSHVIFQKAGKHVYAQIMKNEIPLKTCIFYAK